MSHDLKVALTFDDLPLNGHAPGRRVAGADGARHAGRAEEISHPAVVRVRQRSKLENNPDGALALKLWAKAGNPLANHTYTHLEPRQEFRRGLRARDPAQRAGARAADAPGGKHDFRWLRYPYLHEGDTLEKRRAVRAFLAEHRYQVAETTLDYEDYAWNSAYARCLDRHDENAIAWLRESYRATADEWIRAEPDMSRALWGRDINHVLLLHQGAFSATILPDLFALLKKQGYAIVRSKKRRPTRCTPRTRTSRCRAVARSVEHVVAKHGLTWPKITPKPLEKVTATCQ